ncbi:MAG: hypothetical protein DRJ69_04900 [Thermoprotei archaeon]|nr:MAG: hypothetical protein DRJ69_04900 [Thermoprotei archaeon]
MEECLRTAEEYCRKGLELLSNGDYHDAAEKIWASVKTATMALTRRYLGRVAPPKGVYWRDFVASAFIKAGLPRERAEEEAGYFIDVRDRLHGGCFYGVFYEEREHRPLMERARDYLSLVKKLVKTGVE